MEQPSISKYLTRKSDTNETSTLNTWMAREYLGLCPAAPQSDKIESDRKGVGQMVDFVKKESFVFTTGQKISTT